MSFLPPGRGTSGLHRSLLVDALVLIGELDPSYGGADPQYATMPTGHRYERRNAAVVAAVGYAIMLGYKAGYAPDLRNPGWLIAYIELPTGQVSWHIPEYERSWDGHTTDQKYERVIAYATRAEVEAL